MYHQHYIAIHAGVAIASYCNRRADCYNSHKYAVADTLRVAVTTPATFELSCNILSLCASYLPKISIQVIAFIRGNLSAYSAFHTLGQRETCTPSNSKYNCAHAHNSDARRSLGLGTRVSATLLIRVHLRLRWLVQFTEFLISPFCKGAIMPIRIFRLKKICRRIRTKAKRKMKAARRHIVKLARRLKSCENFTPHSFRCV